MVANDPVTHDMRHLVLRLIEPTDFKFFPGQYIDITVPGHDATRSFSMANTSSREAGQLEFVIKVYPDGLFSHFLDTQLAVGDRLEITGPFGVFTLREGENDLVFVGGGAGMAPILSLLRSMAERGHRPQGDLLLRRPEPRGTCASRTSCARWRRRCRTSVTCRPCPSRPTARSGTARPA